MTTSAKVGFNLRMMIDNARIHDRRHVRSDNDSAGRCDVGLQEMIPVNFADYDVFNSPSAGLPDLPKDAHGRTIYAHRYRPSDWRAVVERRKTASRVREHGWLQQDLSSQPPPKPSPKHDFVSHDRRAPGDIFNPEIVDIPEDLLDAVQHSLKPISADEAQRLWKESWIGRESELILEDREFLAIEKSLALKALIHVGTNILNYMTIASAGYAWVCRNFATLFCAIWAGKLFSDAVGKFLDFLGHHSYNFIWVWELVDDVVEFSILVIEPQADAVVEHADPPHHYVGKSGLGIGGG